MTQAPYNAYDHLIKIKAKDGTQKDYYPAAWRLHELRLRFPQITIESEIIHMDMEHNFVIMKAIIFDGTTYEESKMRASSMKQGLLSALDKVETAAKARAARDFGVSTELALDSEPEEDVETETTQHAPTVMKKRTVEAASANPQPKNPVDELKRQAMKARFITGTTDADLLSMWNNRLRAVFSREVTDQDLLGSEAMRATLRTFIEEYAAKQAKAS